MAVKTYINLLAGVTWCHLFIATVAYSQLPRLLVFLHTINVNCHVMFIQTKWVFSGVVKSVIQLIQVITLAVDWMMLHDCYQVFQPHDLALWRQP